MRHKSAAHAESANSSAASDVSQCAMTRRVDETWPRRNGNTATTIDSRSRLDVADVVAPDVVAPDLVRDDVLSGVVVCDVLELTRAAASAFRAARRPPKSARPDRRR